MTYEPLTEASDIHSQYSSHDFALLYGYMYLFKIWRANSFIELYVTLLASFPLRPSILFSWPSNK